MMPDFTNWDKIGFGITLSIAALATNSKKRPYSKEYDAVDSQKMGNVQVYDMQGLCDVVIKVWCDSFAKSKVIMH